MKTSEFLSAFKNLENEVHEIKMLQQKTILFLESNYTTTSSTSIIEERISVKETCKILGISEVSLWKLRKDGTIPYTQHKRTIRFKKIDILNYLNQKR